MSRSGGLTLERSAQISASPRGHCHVSLTLGNDERRQLGHSAVFKAPHVTIGKFGILAVVILQRDLSERREKLTVLDQLMDFELGRFLVGLCHPATHLC